MRTRVRLSFPAALAAAALLLAAPPSAAPQTFQGLPRDGRDYIYAGSRLLAVADPVQAPVMVELPPEPILVAEGGGPAAVPVRVATRDGGPTPWDVAIAYEAAGGSATAGADYAPFSGEVVVPAGTAHGAPVDDGVDEADETITVALRSVVGALATRPVQDVVLADDDASPLLSVADAQALEDSGTLVFEVALSAPSEREVSVRFEAEGAGAQPGEDYAPASGVLSFPAGATSGRVAVALEPDTDCEGPEQLRLALSAPVNATLGRAEATGTVADDEPPLVEVSNAVAVEADTVAARARSRSRWTIGPPTRRLSPDGTTSPRPERWSCRPVRRLSAWPWTSSPTSRASPCAPSSSPCRTPWARASAGAWPAPSCATTTARPRARWPATSTGTVTPTSWRSPGTAARPRCG